MITEGALTAALTATAKSLQVDLDQYFGLEGEDELARRVELLYRMSHDANILLGWMDGEASRLTGFQDTAANPPTADEESRS